MLAKSHRCWKPHDECLFFSCSLSFILHSDVKEMPAIHQTKVNPSHGTVFEKRTLSTATRTTLVFFLCTAPLYTFLLYVSAYALCVCHTCWDTDMEVQNIFCHLATVSGEYIYVATGYPMILKQDFHNMYNIYIPIIVASNISNTDVTWKSGVRRLHVQARGNLSVVFSSYINQPCANAERSNNGETKHVRYTTERSSPCIHT